MTVRESIVEIGKPTPLVGILSEAVAKGRKDSALILLNSGIMHRVGACRLSVRLARTAAREAGIPCLRFDFSGVGDSAPRRGGMDFDQAAVDEVKEVMDFLSQQRGIKQFIIYGLCSGARIACDVAEQDKRVAAVVQLDGFCYPTVKSQLAYYGRRLTSLKGWRARFGRWLGLGGKVQHSGSVLTGARADFEVPKFASDPGRDAIAAQLQILMARNVRLHSVFTGRDPHYFYHSQYQDCFSDVDFGRKLSVDYFPNASHIFTEPLYQERMIAGVLAWIQDVLGEEEGCAVVDDRASAQEFEEALT